MMLSPLDSISWQPATWPRASTRSASAADPDASRPPVTAR